MYFNNEKSSSLGFNVFQAAGIKIPERISLDNFSVCLGSQLFKMPSIFLLSHSYSIQPFRMAKTSGNHVHTLFDSQTISKTTINHSEINIWT